MTCFYAGHVLGAAMFLARPSGGGCAGRPPSSGAQVRAGGRSVVYTGDYNMTPDRHLGGASIALPPGSRPDLLITESTYATLVRRLRGLRQQSQLPAACSAKVRDSKRTREQRFLERVKQCVEAGGKVRRRGMCTCMLTPAIFPRRS